MGHRHGEDDNGVDVALVLEQPHEMLAPAGRHVAPDHLTDRSVGAAVLGVELGPPQVAVALQSRDGVAGGRECLGLQVERVRHHGVSIALPR